MSNQIPPLDPFDILERDFGVRDADDAGWVQAEAMDQYLMNRVLDTLPCTLTVPFCVPEYELPAPIPTLDEIKKCKGTVNDLTLGKEKVCQRTVYRVNDVFAVKICQESDLKQVC
jgi:hypothetical protein